MGESGEDLFTETSSQQPPCHAPLGPPHAGGVRRRHHCLRHPDYREFGQCTGTVGVAERVFEGSLTFDQPSEPLYDFITRPWPSASAALSREVTGRWSHSSRRRVSMNTQEHVQTARAFLEASDREFEAGDELQASEKLWGAATHALRAVIQPDGHSSGKHRELRMAAERLATSHGDPAIRLGFITAEQFHANFYHGFMEDFQIDDGRRAVREFVERILPDRPPAPPEDSLRPGEPGPGGGRAPS